MEMRADVKKRRSEYGINKSEGINENESFQFIFNHNNLFLNIYLSSKLNQFPQTILTPYYMIIITYYYY